MKTFLKFRLSLCLLAAAALIFASCSDGGDDGDTPPDVTAYGITVSNDGNGTAEATVDGKVVTAAEAGVEVILTAPPTDPDNYVFKQWVAVDGSLPAFTAGAAITSFATFIMPAGAVSIKAEFIQVASINGVVWATCNVDTPGTFASSPESPGMFYQWNRKTAWSATGAVTGWNSSSPTGDSWEAANDPCPTGWHVPTKDEFATLLDVAKVDQVLTTLNGIRGYRFTDKATQATIFLPAAGYRLSSDGALNYLINSGFYWSGYSSSADSAWYLGFGGLSPSQTSTGRAAGFSVRCVRQ